MTGTQLTAAEKKSTMEFLTVSVHKQHELLHAMGIREEIFTRLLLNALVKTPDLARCTKPSLYEAICNACQVGLVPDGKHAAIVAFNRKGKGLVADFWPMIDGRLLLVRNNLKNTSLNAHNVFTQDEFSDVRGSAPKLTHVVRWGWRENRGNTSSLLCYSPFPRQCNTGSINYLHG